MSTVKSSSMLSIIANAVKSAVSSTLSTIANAVKSAVVAPPRPSTESSSFEVNSGESQTVGILFPLGRHFSIARRLNMNSATLFSEETMTLAEEITFNGEVITQEAEVTALFTYSGSGDSSNGRLHLVDVQLTSINTGTNVIPISSNLVNLGQFSDQFRFNIGTSASFEVIIEIILPFEIQINTPAS